MESCICKPCSDEAFDILESELAEVFGTTD